MFFAAAKMLICKAWERLRAVPVWLWAALGWVLAFLVFKSAKKKYEKAKVKSTVERLRQRNLVKRTRRLAKIKQELAEKLFAAEERHRKKKKELTRKEEELDNKKGNAKEITEAVNDAFGDDT